MWDNVYLQKLYNRPDERWTNNIYNRANRSPNLQYAAKFYKPHRLNRNKSAAYAVCPEMPDDQWFRGFFSGKNKLEKGNITKSGNIMIRTEKKGMFAQRSCKYIVMSWRYCSANGEGSITFLTGKKHSESCKGIIAKSIEITSPPQKKRIFFNKNKDIWLQLKKNRGNTSYKICIYRNYYAMFLFNVVLQFFVGFNCSFLCIIF